MVESFETTSSFFPYQSITSIANPSIIATVPLIKKWRLSESSDLPFIVPLIRPATYELFGPFDLPEIMEKSLYSMVMENTEGNIIAYLALNVFPNIPAMLPSVWPDWMRLHYRLNAVKPSNTLFIHLLLWDPRYNHRFLSPMLKSVFLNNFTLEHIILVSPPNAPTSIYMGDSLLKEYFTRNFPSRRQRSAATQTIYICLRRFEVPKLKIRRAVAEDNDDLVWLINERCHILRQIYGNYYIAEIILKTNTPRKIVVAENENFAVGLLCLNSSINLKTINNNFELQPFNFLSKCNNIKPHLYKAQNIFKAINDIQRVIFKRQMEEQFDFSTIVEMMSNHDCTDIEIASSLQQIPLDFFPMYFSDFNEVMHYLNHDSSDSLVIPMPSTRSRPSHDIPSLQSFESLSSEEEHVSSSKESVTDDENSSLSECEDILSSPDAFLIELYGLQKDIDERVAIDMLEACFEIFPDRNYAIISKPTNTALFPLLGYFTQAIHRPVCASTQSIYVVHKNVLLAETSVRLATLDDWDCINEFIHLIPKCCELMLFVKERLYQQQYSLEETDYVFMIINHQYLVGITVIGRCKEYMNLRANFDIDLFINWNILLNEENHGLIHLFYLNQTFEPKMPSIFREIYRLTGFINYYYKISKDTAPYLEMTFLTQMIPIQHRVFLRYNLKKLRHARPANVYLQERDKSALFLYNPIIQKAVKEICDLRIVLVGLGNIGMGFLQHLIFSKHSHTRLFPHLIVVSPEGLPMHSFRQDIDHDFFGSSINYKKHRDSHLMIRSWVNVAYGKMTSLNREKKYMIINKNKKLYYDLMYLFCGTQYDYPSTIKMPQEMPDNFAVINSHIDAKNVVRKIKILMSSTDNYSIIIYGDTIRVYCTLGALIRRGVNPKNIVLIKSGQKSKGKSSFLPPAFNDTYVMQKMAKIIQEYEITVYEKHTLVGWNIDVYGMITNIHLETSFNLIQLPCSFFLCFERKSVAIGTLKAMNDSGLVFDGHLVINTNFETNDPNIMAAGTFTKYKRVLYANQYRHENYSTEEIGEVIAEKLIEKISGKEEEKKKAAEENLRSELSAVVPQFKQPKAQYSVVLGDYNFLYIRNPGTKLPHQAEKCQKDYGMDIMTGIPQRYYKTVKQTPEEMAAEDVECEERGYFRIHLDKYDIVRTICCFTKHHVHPELIGQLYGKHESMLFDLKSCYLNGEITDLFDWFDEPKMYAIFHDRFESLQKKNLELMSSAELDGSCGSFNLKKNIMTLIAQNDWKAIADEDRKWLLRRFTSTIYHQHITDNLHKFLSEFEDALPMYCVLDNVDSSLLDLYVQPEHLEAIENDDDDTYKERETYF